MRIRWRVAFGLISQCVLVILLFGGITMVQLKGNIERDSDQLNAKISSQTLISFSYISDDIERYLFNMCSRLGIRTDSNKGEEFLNIYADDNIPNLLVWVRIVNIPADVNVSVFIRTPLRVPDDIKEAFFVQLSDMVNLYVCLWLRITGKPAVLLINNIRACHIICRFGKTVKEPFNDDGGRIASGG